MIRFLNKDGHGLSTEIVDAETGADITKILSVSYGIQITLDRDMAKAKCELLIVGADVTANTEWLTKHPVSGEFVALAALEFRDGTRVEFSADGSPKVITVVTDLAA